MNPGIEADPCEGWTEETFAEVKAEYDHYYNQLLLEEELNELEAIAEEFCP